MQEGYKSQWLRIVKAAPEVLEGSSNKHQNWELFDPEKWVPDGYVLVRVDSRGAGRSPGYLETWSPREAQGHRALRRLGRRAAVVERQGRPARHLVLLDEPVAGGAAASRKHLAALCIWEGSSDYYRELCRHGGILCDFYSSWYPRQVTAVQHGVGERGAKSVVTGEPVAGPRHAVRRRTEEEPRRLRRRRAAPPADRRLPRGAAAEVRGHRDAAVLRRQLGRHGAASARQLRGLPARRLEAEMAGGARRHALHAVLRQVRPGPAEAVLRPFPQGRGQRLGQAAARCCSTSAIPARNSSPRAENEWPLARTQWTKLYLHSGPRARSAAPPRTARRSPTQTHERRRDASRPSRWPRRLEITGPVAAKLFVSSDTTDADLFLVLRVFDPHGKEVTFIGSNDPRVPVGLGWLRASHRKLDPKREQALPAVAHP